MGGECIHHISTYFKIFDATLSVKEGWCKSLQSNTNHVLQITDNESRKNLYIGGTNLKYRVKKLDLTKQEREVVENALSHWQASNLLEAGKVEELKQTIDERGFEWEHLARYAFWIALVSLIFAVFSLFADDALIRFAERLYDTPNFVFWLFFAVFEVLFYVLRFRNKKRYPEKKFSNEPLLLAGSLATA